MLAKPVNGTMTLHLKRRNEYILQYCRPAKIVVVGKLFEFCLSRSSPQVFLWELQSVAEE